jgi:hypothetical protein
LLIVETETVQDAHAALLNSHVLPHTHLNMTHQQAKQQFHSAKATIFESIRPSKSPKRSKIDLNIENQDGEESYLEINKQTPHNSRIHSSHARHNRQHDKLARHHHHHSTEAETYLSSADPANDSQQIQLISVNTKSFASNQNKNAIQSRTHSHRQLNSGDIEEQQINYDNSTIMSKSNKTKNINRSIRN